MAWHPLPLEPGSFQNAQRERMCVCMYVRRAPPCPSLLPFTRERERQPEPTALPPSARAPPASSSALPTSAACARAPRHSRSALRTSPYFATGAFGFSPLLRLFFSRAQAAALFPRHGRRAPWQALGSSVEGKATSSRKAMRLAPSEVGSAWCDASACEARLTYRNLRASCGLTLRRPTLARRQQGRKGVYLGDQALRCGARAAAELLRLAARGSRGSRLLLRCEASRLRDFRRCDLGVAHLALKVLHLAIAEGIILPVARLLALALFLLRAENCFGRQQREQVGEGARRERGVSLSVSNAASAMNINRIELT